MENAISFFHQQLAKTSFWMTADGIDLALVPSVTTSFGFSDGS